MDLKYTTLFLIVSYGTWGAGIYTNLKANWRLLEETGISTNALSKAGHDLVTRNKTIQQIAAGAGYIILELVKELPYYIGAFGAAAVSSGISANESLIFLGGANIGAAAYEYGLGKATQGFLNLKRFKRLFIKKAIITRRMSKRKK